MPSPIGGERHAGGECRSPPSRSFRQDQDAASDSSSVQSGEVPERRDIDILAQVLSTRSEEYRLLFRLPHDEVLVQDFNCALQENILLQGHMYLFLHHICFYSNIFGYETKRTISYYEITCVRKAKTAAIFPTAIEIMTGEKRHFFGSFLSRDEAYKIIMEGYQQHRSDSGALMDCLESKSETRSLEGTPVTLEPESCSPPQANGSTCGGSAVIDNLEILENGKVNGGASSEDGWSWQPEEADAPRVPDYFTLVAEGKFPVHVEEFFKLFFSDAAVDFLQNFHTTCGDKDFHCSRWHRNAEFVHARDLSFRHPIKIYFGAKLGHCHTIQKFRVYRNSHLVIEASQQVSDIPYGDYFHVQVLWDVEEDINETNGCSLQVYINLAFSRKTMWKGKIEQNTIDECREVYEIWIRNAHELLKEKNLEEHQGVYSSVTNITEGHDVELESSVKPRHSKELLPSPHTSVPEMPRAAKTEMLLPPPENFTSFAECSKFYNPMITFIKGSWTNLALYTRSIDRGSLSLIAAVVIIFMLIQLSGIILLTRTTEVRVISHDYHMNGLTHDRTEIVDWLDKRVQLLNEEMSVMEIRMERLKQEYSFLKGQLQDLRQFKRQQ